MIPEFQEAQARALYRLLNHGAEYTDCRCLDINRPGSPPISREVLRGEKAFIDWCKKFHGKGNCYVGRNPRKADATVSRVTTYSLDIDPEHPPRTSVDAALLAKAVCGGRSVLRRWPGGYLAESGNGAMVVYRLQHPVSAEFEKVSGWLARWQERVRGLLADSLPGVVRCDSIHDNERIIKIPGTLSVKGDPKHWRLARWLEVPAAPYRTAPMWELPPEEIKAGGRSSNPKGWITDALASLRDGNRNTTFTKVAGRLRSDGWDEKDITGLLTPHAAACEFPSEELDTIIKSVCRYEPRKRGGLVIMEDNKPEAMDVFMDDIKPVDWICPPIVAKGAIGFIAGLPETMKTWAMVDLAIEVARAVDGSWLGLFPVTPGKVLYIDQERFKGETQRRFKGVMGAKGLRAADLKASLYIRCGTTTRLDLEPSFQAFRRELDAIRPDLVLVDSFATFHTKEENSRHDIQEVMERVKALRREFGCTFLFVDHENKGVFHAEDDEAPSAFRMAGSVAKPAAAEFVLTVRRFDRASSKIYHTKSTLSSTVPSFTVSVHDTPEGYILVRGVR